MRGFLFEHTLAFVSIFNASGSEFTGKISKTIIKSYGKREWTGLPGKEDSLPGYRLLDQDKLG